ncbi:MAG: CDP-alcohol phosphatidyltransferase family protein [Myxococcales bacterium]|nr:CDP-alcohol phosphatidyltransferase family protein [Myxococcales bacterium]
MKLFDSFPARYVAPNAVTCVGLVFGLASIRTSLTATGPEGFATAAWFILYAVLLDKLDGAVARRLNASSEFGVQLDSFSDFVTFGISPAALVSRAVPTLLPEPWSSGLAATALQAVAAVYVLAAAARLAKFNLTTATNDPRFFRGLPSTSSGGLLASAFLAHQSLSLPAAWLTGLVVWMASNLVLMVSNLPMPKLKISPNPVVKAGQLVVMLTVYVFIPLHRFAPYLIALSTLYTVGGFIYGVAVTSREADPAPAVEQRA